VSLNAARCISVKPSSTESSVRAVCAACNRCLEPGFQPSLPPPQKALVARRCQRAGDYLEVKQARYHGAVNLQRAQIRDECGHAGRGNPRERPGLLIQLAGCGQPAEEAPVALGDGALGILRSFGSRARLLEKPGRQQDCFPARSILRRPLVDRQAAALRSERSMGKRRHRLRSPTRSWLRRSAISWSYWRAARPWFIRA
jgi:hypothetical protein